MIRVAPTSDHPAVVHESPSQGELAVVTMPVGTPMTETEATRDKVVAAARAVIAANGGAQQALGVRAKIDGTRIDVRVFLTPPEVRQLQTREFTSAWRKALGPLPSARAIRLAEPVAVC